MKALGPVFPRFSFCFPMVSLWELMTPRAGPFLIPGAWLAGFIKRNTTHCYTQNMKALGLVVLEIFLLFFPRRTRGVACIDPRGMVGRIYKKDHYTLLHTKYESSWPCGFGKEDFYVFSMMPLVCGLYGPQRHCWQDL